MNQIEKRLIRDLKSGKNMESNIPEYVREMSENYLSSALLDMVMEYVSLYETWRENLNPNIKLNDSENELFIQLLQNWPGVNH